jgi:hypothetical protein
VEIACTDIGAEVAHRIQIDEFNVRRARAKAQMVLGAWRDHSPKYARVLNSRNKQLCCLKWTEPGTFVRTLKSNEPHLLPPPRFPPPWVDRGTR